jgi:hypothetical protein
MKKPPSSLEFARFAAALGEIVKVSPDEIERRMQAQKKEGKRFSRGASLDVAAADKIRSSFGN